LEGQIVNRRKFLTHLTAPTGLVFASYAFVIEPDFMMRIVTRKISPPNWTPGLKLRALTITDPHVVEPYMSLARWEKIIETANDLQPDIVFMLGDYVSNIDTIGTPVPVAKTAKAAAKLKAPLGVFSINGNHDWWGDPLTQKTRKGPPEAQKAFEDAGIPVLANKAVRVIKDGLPFWVTGTDSMIAIRLARQDFIGFDRLVETLAQVTDMAPIIHLAHEPDLFVKIPARVSLTLCGHTHGGQVRIGGFSPIVPSSYGNRFAYGHIVEDGRHLVVSSGLGCSTLPLRFGVPPEISILELS
jgi:uncharacterized protein